MHKLMELIFASVVTFILFIAAIIYTYTYTKESYTAVGFNNGNIYTNSKFMEKIRAIADPMNGCSEFNGNRDRTILVEVKSEAIYILRDRNDGYTFCAK